MRDQTIIRLLGEPAVIDGTEHAVLPSSKKARALLAYLALTGRPHRRERLCELFWDLPDDPRGSLRWALSKLRPVVNSNDRERIVADRERVLLDASDAHVDFVVIRKRLLDDPPLIPLPELRQMAEALANPLLDGLDMPQLEAFNGWLVAEREDAAMLYVNVLRRLALHPDIVAKEAVKWARLWFDADPLNRNAAAALVQILRQSGRGPEAEIIAQEFRSAADAVGITVDDVIEQPDSSDDRPVDEPRRRMLRHQVINFCTAEDGVRIAYATVGDGPPLVKAANWLNHLELDWDSSIWGKTFQKLAEERRFIRYDERGNGLSDWEVDDISFEAFVRDLESVADALGLEKFPLLGMSQGCAVSIEYAVRHPERVTGLILIGGYASGWRIGATADERERRDAVMTLTRLGWGTSNPAYRHIFSQTFMPNSEPGDLEWFDEFQRQTTSPENAVRFQDAFGEIDVRDRLGEVSVPTLVLHARDDRRISLKQGRELAIGIPDARFVALDSANHIILGHEPAWQTCMDEIERFLTEKGL